MAAKSEAKETAAPEAAAPEAAAGKPPVAPAPAGLKAWLPALLVLLLAPTACWAVAEFVLLPRLQAQLAIASGAAPASAPAAAAGHGAPVPPGAAVETYEFTNVVVNLSGTMGTRYLKCSFVITGAEPGIRPAFEGRKAQLTDVTLNVLSSLTLSDLEEPGAKNLLRERLVGAYNQVLGRRVADQVYFSDFVVQ